MKYKNKGSRIFILNWIGNSSKVITIIKYLFGLLLLNNDVIIGRYYDKIIDIFDKLSIVEREFRQIWWRSW